MTQSVIEKPPLPRRGDPYAFQRERCRSVLTDRPSSRLTPGRAKRELKAAKGRSAEVGIIQQNRRAAREEAAADRRIDRRFKTWLRNLHRRDRNWGVRVRTPKPQRIPMGPKRDKPDRRNTRSLPAYRRPIIDKLGRRGIVLTFEYDGAARNSFGVFRRRVEYGFQSDEVQRDASGTPFFVSNMGKSALEICEASDALEGVMRAERANAKLSVNVVLQFPHDSTVEQQLEITRRFCSEVFGSHDLAHVAVLHKPDPAGDQRNFHAHITFAFRQIVRTGDYQWAIGANLRTDLDSPDQLFEYRKIAAEVMTTVMRKAGHNRIYTHFSNAERGLAVIPQKKLTKAQSNQVRRGVYVGANEYNAREVATGEQALERSVSKVIPVIEVMRASAGVIPVGLLRRAVDMPDMPIAEQKKFPIYVPCMTRLFPKEPIRLGQAGYVRLAEPRPLQNIVPPFVKSTLDVGRPVLDLPRSVHILTPLRAGQLPTFAPFVSLNSTSTTGMPMVIVQPLAQRASMAAPPPRRNDLSAALGLGNRLLPPPLIAVRRAVKRPRQGPAALPPERPRAGFAIKISRPNLARSPLFNSVPLYTQHSPVRPNLIMLTVIQPVRVVGVRKAQGLLRVVAQISTQVVPPSRDNRTWPLFVQPVSTRCPTVVSLRSSPIITALLMPATAPVLATPTAPALAVRPAAMRRIVGQSRPRLLARADPTRLSLIGLGTRNQATRLGARCRRCFQLPQISFPAPSADASLQVSGSGIRKAEIEFEPLSVTRLVRSTKISAALPSFLATRRSTKLLRPVIFLAQAPHQLVIARARSEPKLKAVRSSEALPSLFVPPPGRVTSHFASDLDQIRSARDQLADRVIAMSSQGKAVPAIGSSLNPVEENANSRRGEKDALTQAAGRQEQAELAKDDTKRAERVGSSTRLPGAVPSMSDFDSPDVRIKASDTSERLASVNDRAKTAPSAAEKQLPLLRQSISPSNFGPRGRDKLEDVNELELVERIERDRIRLINRGDVIVPRRKEALTTRELACLLLLPTSAKSIKQRQDEEIRSLGVWIVAQAHAIATGLVTLTPEARKVFVAFQNEPEIVSAVKEVAVLKNKIKVTDPGKGDELRATRMRQSDGSYAAAEARSLQDQAASGVRSTGANTLADPHQAAAQAAKSKGRGPG